MSDEVKLVHQKYWDILNEAGKVILNCREELESLQTVLNHHELQAKKAGFPISDFIPEEG